MSPKTHQKYHTFDILLGVRSVSNRISTGGSPAYLQPFGSDLRQGHAQVSPGGSTEGVLVLLGTVFVITPPEMQLATPLDGQGEIGYVFGADTCGALWEQADKVCICSHALLVTWQV